MADIEDEVTDLLTAPLGELIAAVGKGVAEAQEALDNQALEQFKRLYQEDGDILQELRKVGYQPTWYRIPEADAEIKVVLTASETRRTTSSGATPSRRNISLSAMPVDATVANQFNFNFAAASSVKFKVVPIPPPALLDSQSVVPDLVGKSREDAETTLRATNINWTLEPEDTAAEALVSSQSHEAGVLISSDDQFRLKFFTS